MSILNYSVTLLLFALQLFSAANAATAHHPKPRGYTTSTLNVGNGIELGYLDSGSPGTKTYTTIFAIHGMGYYSRKYALVASPQSCADTSYSRFPKGAPEGVKSQHSLRRHYASRLQRLDSVLILRLERSSERPRLRQDIVLPGTRSGARDVH